MAKDSFGTVHIMISIAPTHSRKTHLMHLSFLPQAGVHENSARCRQVRLWALETDLMSMQVVREQAGEASQAKAKPPPPGAVK